MGRESMLTPEFAHQTSLKILHGHFCRPFVLGMCKVLKAEGFYHPTIKSPMSRGPRRFDPPSLRRVHDKANIL